MFKVLERMKRILIAVVALLVVNSAFSQVKVGVKAGANLSSLSGVEMSAFGISLDMFESDGMSLGFHGGVFANISFGGYLGLQPELLFSMQGGEQKLGKELLEEMGIPFGNIKLSYRFNYINLPILLEIKPVPLVDLGLLVGPQFGLNIYKSETAMGITTSGSEFDNGLKELFGKNPFNSLDVGLVFGLQYTFIDHLNVGLRYNLGLTNSISSTYENGLFPTTYKVDVTGWKNSVFQLSVGWFF